MMFSSFPDLDQTAQSTEDPRFPGRGRTLSSGGTGRGDTTPGLASDSNLQTRLLDNTSPDSQSNTTINSGGGRFNCTILLFELTIFVGLVISSSSLVHLL